MSTHPKVQFRELQRPDLALLQQVGRDSYVPYYPHLWKPGGMEWYLHRCFSAEALNADFADPNIAYFLASDPAGKHIGFLKLVLLKTTPDGLIPNALYLEKIYLLPDFFGKGLGQHLLAFAEKTARDLGREAMWLCAMKTGPRHVYEKAGYAVVGELPIEFELMKAEERWLWVMLKRLGMAI